MFIGFASSKKNAPDPAAPQSQGEEDELHDEDEHSVGDEINATLIALMPWGISILFHVALVVVALFLVWQVIQTSEEDPPIVPSSNLSDTPGAPEQMEEVKLETTDSAPTNPNPTPDPTPNPSPTNNTLKASEMAGLTASGGAPSGGPFSLNDGQGQFNTAMFGGGGGSARNIAFVIDASGSMVDVLPFVVNELKRVVNGLQAEQTFTVIFFSGEGVFEVPGGGARAGLRSATPEFKQAVREWVTLDNHEFQTGGRGSVNAITAIEKALGHRPQLVYLLSDNLTGGGQGATQYEIFQDDLMDRINDENKKLRPPAKFNTLQFLYTDPLVNAGREGTMKLIADSTNGTYHFVSEAQLNLK